MRARGNEPTSRRPPKPDDEALLKSLPKKQQSALRFLIAAGRPMTASQLMVQAECTQGPIRSTSQKRAADRIDSPRDDDRRCPCAGNSDDGEETETHELTDDQQRALTKIIGALDSAQTKHFGVARRDRQRQNRSLYSSDRACGPVRPRRDRAGARDQPDAANARPIRTAVSLPSPSCTAK